MVVIIDGNNQFAKSYFATKELVTSKGDYTNGIFTFLKTLRSLKNRFKNDHIIVAWDGGNKARKEISPTYKSNRKPFPDEYYQQLNRTIDTINTLGVEQYRIKDVEADDIIGTLAIKSRKRGKKVLIISNDHDFQQLISPHIKILRLIKVGVELIVDEKYLKDNISLRPNQIIDLLSLTGDGTDSVDGIPGVGEKIASKLLVKYNDVEYILNNIDKLDITENLRKKIKNNIETVRLAKRLVTINHNLDINPLLKKGKFDFERLYNIFEYLEFKSFIKNFDKWKKDFTT